MLDQLCDCLYDITRKRVQVFMSHFMRTAEQIANQIDAMVWGPPLIILLALTGLRFTIVLRGIQFTQLWHSL